MKKVNPYEGLSLVILLWSKIDPRGIIIYGIVAIGAVVFALKNFPRQGIQKTVENYHDSCRRADRYPFDWKYGVGRTTLEFYGTGNLVFCDSATSIRS